MKKFVIFSIIFSSLISSCKKNVLDITPLDRVSEEAVWNDESLTRAYQNGLYNGLPQGFARHMISKFSDEAFGEDLFQTGTYTPDNIVGYTGDFNYVYYYDRAYQYIRKCNVFLEKADATPLLAADKVKLKAEVMYLRAFMYFELIKRYGGVPLVAEAYDLGDSVSFKRNTFEECINFIAKNLDDAYAALPAKYTPTDANFGRATQDACLALRSRLFLYAASPLFNGGSIATDANLKAITSYPVYDINRWQKAADAAAALLTRGYSLFPSYQNTFLTVSGNNELIFARTWSASNAHQATQINTASGYGGFGGWSGRNCPTQTLVDDYDMSNGQPPYIYPGGIKTINPASGFNVNAPYSNRDPRLDASILRDELVFRGRAYETWFSSTGTGPNGRDSRKNGGDFSQTSYNLRKFMNETLPINQSQLYTEPWIWFRLSEIYLNYAEAKFELGDEVTARQYLSLVRARAGMPAIPATVTGDDLRKRIYNERRIEMAFEGHRFFDVRRWKIAGQTEKVPVNGVDILRDPATGIKTYVNKIITNRVWNDKMYLLPIATVEINKNKGSVAQNPGW